MSSSKATDPSFSLEVNWFAVVGFCPSNRNLDWWKIDDLSVKFNLMPGKLEDIWEGDECEMVWGCVWNAVDSSQLSDPCRFEFILFFWKAALARPESSMSSTMLQTMNWCGQRPWWRIASFSLTAPRTGSGTKPTMPCPLDARRAPNWCVWDWCCHFDSLSKVESALLEAVSHWEWTVPARIGLSTHQW